MESINYSKLYQGLIKNLPDKTVQVFNRRFGIGRKEAETLESIGKSMDITRERVRQIEAVGFNRILEQKNETLEKALGQIENYLKKNGGFKREDLILADLGGKNNQPYILFLLSLSDKFNKIFGKKDYASFWTTKKDAKDSVIGQLAVFANDLKKIGKPMVKNEFVAQFAVKYNVAPEALISYLEVSKTIKENKENKIGLVSWPDINPKGVRDRAFLVFNKEKKPLHFTQVAKLIDAFNYNLPNKKTLPQTVHNELIKDQRFVLVGRGTYALKEWGYVPGNVKDVLMHIMKANNGPMDKDEIVQKALGQRIVAKNTVLINLNDKKYFAKNDVGKYILRKTEIA